ncbi:MAG: hypothetical protein H7232_02305 [Aeromicrobium sp.]|nr:hypothetical protein [Burkholderiales bacterium]
MSLYITRVFLHGAPTAAQYETLHEIMKSTGFDRTIRDYNGVLFHLPPAEYAVESLKDLTTVQASAHAQAMKLGILCAVMTTKSDGIQWNGLDRVRY